MNRRHWLAGTLVLLGCAALAPAHAADPAPTAAPTPRIVWYSTWKQGFAEAQRTGRPILLIAAAPHCHNVSGIW